MKYKLKVCGMKYADNIKAVAALKPDYMGFIFYEESKRFVGYLDEEVIGNLPSSIKKVGVFVNEVIEDILELHDKYNFDFVQLHGDESPEFCLEMKNFIPVIKAFSIEENIDFNMLKRYKKSCDYFLFDTQTASYGGSGKKFNWDLLKKYDNEIPIFLSGGISLEDAAQIKKLKEINIHAIDINSRFEKRPGLKDIILIKEFMNRLK
ncbi:MAG TPA: phosphoribosylanthranilate isomerase [Cytophagaceae bacterium]|jgi:phosphoribosylanthranilate isomerase|nr:phosphoribosylanthranilate isomerase [Cytophagaceae bacterium]